MRKNPLVVALAMAFSLVAPAALLEIIPTGHVGHAH